MCRWLVWGVLAVGLGLWWAWGAGVGADAPVPDRMRILSVRTYPNMLEPNDALMLVHFEVHYDTLPQENIASTFLVQVRQGGQVVSVVSPYPYVRKGYGENLVGFLYPPGGLTWQGAYEVCVVGSPVAFANPPQVCTQGIEWVPPLFGKGRLRGDIISLSRSLEAHWTNFTLAISLVAVSAEGHLLSERGEDFWLTVVPALRGIVPDLFASRLVAGQFDERAQTPLAVADQWVGSVWGEARDAWADLLGVPPMLVSTLAVVLAGTGLAWFLYTMTRSTEVSALAYLVALPLGAYLGLVPVVVAGLVVAGVLVVVGLLFYMRQFG